MMTTCGPVLRANYLVVMMLTGMTEWNEEPVRRVLPLSWHPRLLVELQEIVSYCSAAVERQSRLHDAPVRSLQKKTIKVCRLLHPGALRQKPCSSRI